jgi:hypothetical protein
LLHELTPELTPRSFSAHDQRPQNGRYDGRMSQWQMSLAVACFAAVASSAPQRSPSGREFVFQLTPAPAPESCTSWWQVAGQNRGWGETKVRVIGPDRFAIPTELDSKPGKSLQIATWCRGYGMSLIDVKELEKSTFSQSVMLAPLGEKEISGRVLSAPDGTSLVGATVTVTYSAPWVCSFFQRGDCGTPSWTVAKAQIGADGVVQFRVPDFLGDPAIKDRPMTEPFGIGGFSLRAELRRWLYELKPGEPEQLRVRTSYSPIVFQPGPPR